jgi:hypothetical protein
MPNAAFWAVYEPAPEGAVFGVKVSKWKGKLMWN